jgi:elongation factor P--beta-lysine ligase
MDKHSRWEDYIHFVELAYNNGYHESLKMSHLNHYMTENETQ